MTYYIHGATVLDPIRETAAVRDLIVADGMVTALSETLPCPDGAQVIEAAGMYLTTGWIDSHVHLQGIVHGDDMLKNGVTYVQDAGSPGCRNFDEYYNDFVKDSKIRVSSYMYLAPYGIDPTRELQDLSVIDYDEWAETFNRYPGVIHGVKLRIDPRVCSDIPKALAMARELADRMDLPVIVHASRSPVTLDSILGVLKKGDIFAHIYANKLPGLLDENGKVKACAWDAKERGVCFDLAHGNGNFSFKVCKTAFEQGFFCDSVSTDLHERSFPRVKSLAMTMGKAMACGLDLYSVLRKVTVESAAMLGLTDKQLTVEAGKPADLVLFKLAVEDLELPDSDGETMTVSKHFRPVVTMLNDGVYWAE